MGGKPRRSVKHDQEVASAFLSGAVGSIGQAVEVLRRAQALDGAREYTELVKELVAEWSALYKRKTPPPEYAYFELADRWYRRLAGVFAKRTRR